MNLLQTIDGQLSAQPMPLTAITIAAVTCPDTPVILTLHWHGFVKDELPHPTEAGSVSYSPLPSAALQVNHRWDDLMELDFAALEAGWELGAWDVARSECPPCGRPGAQGTEGLECLQAFAGSIQGLGDSPLTTAEAPDAAELLDVAARGGYVVWRFRPVHHGVWAEFARDATLGDDGRRPPTCPVQPVPIGAQPRGRTIYRFGLETSAVN